MTNLPREIQPDSALEERVVSTLVAAGLVRRRRVWPVWVAAAAAVIVLAFGVTMFRPTHTLAPGKTYVVLLYEDSTYRPAPAGHDAERVAVLARWADSLDTFGKFERAGRLRGPGPLGGLFMYGRRTMPTRRGLRRRVRSRSGEGTSRSNVSSDDFSPHTPGVLYAECSTPRVRLVPQIHRYLSIGGQL